MAVVPIGTYFSTLNYLWDGASRCGFPSGLCQCIRLDACLCPTVAHSLSRYVGSTTFAAISAIAAANLILVGYVVVAFREDAASRTGPLPEKKTS